MKVQYPGVDEAIRSDLDNAELLYSMFSAFALKDLDDQGPRRRAAGAHGRRARLPAGGPLPAEFADRYAATRSSTSPTSSPSVARSGCSPPSGSTACRGTSSWPAPTHEAQQRAAEIIFRFAEGSIRRHRVFNGDPHPGNYRFHPDGTVTFLDFGLVKRWDPASWSAHADPRRHRRARTRAARRGHGARRLPAAGPRPRPRPVFEYVRARTGRTSSTSSRSPGTTSRETLARSSTSAGPYADVIYKLNMPPSFVILDRVVWGVSACSASSMFRTMAGDDHEYRKRRPAGHRTRRRRSGMARQRPVTQARQRPVTQRVSARLTKTRQKAPG